ncbi:MAG: efflux RND transporter periplasmic adaptor subunit [Candidatus Tectomicrobia bacterium]|uniref:Efflux RND transporter periplasmic adaptor subunit n=1 Tax=Tectimicrobiota bacterium TaxID=2528274 RepID=A0A932M1H8_UNCTE|nr:efflux RND transporter periplasmic adaptor subunit [Candidatus Tectomicrobia bacterium]
MRPSYRNLSYVFLLAVLILTLFGCRKEEPRPPEPQVSTALQARVETVAKTSVPDAFWAVGTVKARTTAEVSSRILGTVKELWAREGAIVSAGEVLAVIDDRDLAAQVRRAEAALDEARRGIDEVDQSLREAAAALSGTEANRQYAAATLSRYSQLFQEKSVSPHEYEGVQAKARAAEAQVEQARARILSLEARKKQVEARIAQAQAETGAARVALGYATVVAPFRGQILEKKAEVGDMAAPGRPLIVMEETGHHRLEAGVGETEIATVRRGQAVAVQIDALGEKNLSGRVAEIVPAADPASRTFTVKIDLPPLPSLRSGLYGTASFPRERKEAVLIPAGALVTRGQLQGVFVVDGQNTARLRLVKTGATYDGRIEILSGLAAGERILTSEVSRAADGGRVQALP